ncbi:MAG: right-handed parallel beta-helix repeat-containing protein [Planctomycetes bacterium]|nr:right-handed parallel beta-helix repeat-containing protein [Planctomycetota bacterium]
MTLLTGDLQDDDGPTFANRDDNSFHIVTCRNCDSDTLVEGVTITGGEATGPADGYGGGFLCENSAPTIRDCVVQDNHASLGGAGLYDCDGMLEGSVIHGNSAGLGHGGGLADCAGVVRRCAITANAARIGAGAYDCDGDLVDCEIANNAAHAAGGGLAGCDGAMLRCRLSGNTAGNSGGAVYDCQGAVTSCIITGNRAGIYGGGLASSHGSVANCVVAGNSAQIGGGGLWSCNGPVTHCTIISNRTTAGNEGGAVGECNGGFTNCIFWGNSNPYWANSFPYPTYSCAPALGFEPGNIESDPRLVDLGRFAGSQWIDGDYRLHKNSPCIDSGDAAATDSAGLTADVRGFTRVYDAAHAANSGPDAAAPVDMGAVEYGDCNSNLLPDVDEIAAGESADCNGNDIPDECIALEMDCNANGTPDVCDLASGTADCTGNGIPDDCEPDCNADGHADSCDIDDGTSPDCNGNGIPDECDVSSGDSQDSVPLGGDGVPDECQEDCNANGVIDSVDITTGTATDCDGNAVPDGCELFLTPGPATVLNTNAALDRGGDYGARLTYAGRGIWLAVWYANDAPGWGIATDYDILLSRSTDSGRTWTAPLTLNVDAPADPLADAVPCIATDGAGRVVVAWLVSELPFYSGSDNDLLVSYSADYGATWSLPNSVAPDVTDHIGAPEVAGGAKGVFLLAWSTFPTNDGRSWVARSTDGGATWGQPRELTGNVRGREPHVATDGADIAFAVWQYYTGYATGYWDIALSQSHDGGATWSTSVLAGGAGIQIDPRIATDGNGNWVVVWRSDRLPDGSTADFEVMTTHSADNGRNWSAPQILDTHWAQEPSRVEVPQIATDGRGYWVAWWQLNGIVFATSRTNGATWSNPKRLASSGVYYTDIAGDGEGKWLAVWSSADDFGGLTGADYDVYVSGLGAAGDCNGNDTLDACDVHSGWSTDCDADGVPDECQPDSDCNENGNRDICDVAAGVSADCSANGVPDECEADCNGNGRADSCDVLLGEAADCNGDVVPDSCDLAAGSSFDEFPVGGDGVPDECQGLIRFPHPRYATIQAAIYAAPGGGTVLVSPGTYVGGGNRDLGVNGRNMSIRCDGMPGSCVLDCDRGGRGFNVTGSDIGPATVIEGFTVRNGLAEYEGGGMRIEDASPTVRACRFEQNETDAVHAAEGGGVVVLGAQANPRFFDCAFSGNRAPTAGGGVYAWGVGSLTLENCRFSDNRAYSGAGLSCGTMLTVAIGCTFLGNVAEGTYPGDGGGFYISGGDQSEAVLDWCTVQDNRAAAGAGGLLAASRATVTNCRFLGNRTSGGHSGGGLDVRSSTSMIRNSLFSRNTARGGSALYLRSGEATVSGCTVVSNICTSAYGPAIEAGFGTTRVELLNSIVWNNGWVPFTVSRVEAKYCLFDTARPGVGNIAGDPLFLGSGLDKFLLSRLSPCVDAGDPNTIPAIGELDLEGQPRLNGKQVDIGADEYHPRYVRPAHAFEGRSRSGR